MRLNDFIEEQTIVEVPMNPSTFAAAIDTGQEQGVLVGFEFEVYIPGTFFVQPSVAPTTKEQFARKFNDVEYLEHRTTSEFTPTDFDTYFKFKKPVNGFNNTQQAYDSLLKKRLTLAVKLFNKVEESERARLIRKAKKRGILDKTKNSITDQLKFTQFVGQELADWDNYHTSDYELGLNLQSASVINWQSVWNWILRSDATDNITGLLQLMGNFNNVVELTKTPNETYYALKIPEVEEELEYDVDENDDYPMATEKLKPMIASVMGAKVTVFDEYHARKKNTTHWYIEPDGSLSMPEEVHDVGLEIVSPPLPAITAIDALKKFFAMAQENKFYTNTSTGLHINVSIPQTLDVLKLAVFLGDQYVMKYFGRENNRHVAGTMQGMSRDIRINPNQEEYTNIKTLKQPGVINQPNQTSTFNMNALQQLATDNSTEHTSSISDNGKYISFRHAGGNYLADYSAIYNSVGRFIRAMIIASTPELYAQEYKTKIAKLLAQPELKQYGPNDKIIAYLRKNGLPIIELDIMKINAKKSMNIAIKDVLATMLGTAPGNNVIVQQNNQNSKNSIVNNYTPNNEVVKEKIKNAPLTEFAKITVIPEEPRDLSNFINRATSTNVVSFKSIRNGYDISGYVYLNKIMLPPTDPRTQAFIKKMLKKQYTPQ